MKYWIIKQDRGISVRIEDLRGQEDVLLEKIRQCRQSAWACPSGECRNVDSIDEHTQGESLFLTLKPRPDTELDRGGIEECLRYMLQQPAEA